MQNLAQWFISNRKKLFIITLLSCLFGAYQVSKMRADFSYRVWFASDDKKVVTYEKFRKDFGSEDFLSIALHHPNGIFRKDILSFIANITDKLYYLKYVANVDSLSSISIVKGTKNDLIIEPIVDPEQIQNLSVEDIEKLKKKSLNHEIYSNYVLNSSGDTTMLFLKVDKRFDKSIHFKELYQQAVEFMQKQSLPVGLEYHITGNVSVISALSEEVTRDIKVIIPTLLLFLFIILVFVYRSVVFSLVPFMVVAITLLLTFAVSTIFDVTYNPVTSMSPHILTALCISDAVHIISSYKFYMKQGMSKEEAINQSCSSNLVPTFLTSITTFIGFISLSMAQIQPIAQLGIVAGLGTLFAWLISYTVLPFLLHKLPAFKMSKSKLGQKLNKNDLPNNYMVFIRKNVGYIFTMTLILSIFAFKTAQKNKVNSRAVTMLEKAHKVRVAQDFVKKKMGAATGVEVLLVNDSKANPNFLNKVEEFSTWLSSKPEIYKVLSINHLVKDINRAIVDGKGEQYKIPSNPKHLQEIIMLYQMMEPDQIGKWITNSQKRIRVSALWNTGGSARAKALIGEMNNKINELGLKGLVTGKNALLTNTNDYLVSLFGKSIGCAIVLIFFIMFFHLKSFKLAALSLIPNLFPILLGAGVMQFLGLEIDFGTVMVASVCLGIAIDDTIHFLYNYKKCLNKNLNNFDSLVETLSHTGMTLITTTLVLVLSFSSFLLGKVSINYNFGLLAMCMITFALIADLLVLPTLLVRPLFRPKRLIRFIINVIKSL